MTDSSLPPSPTPRPPQGVALAQPATVSLTGAHLAALSQALTATFDQEGLQHLLAMHLDGDLTLRLADTVAVPGRTTGAICDDLVRWALRDRRIGLQGLLAAALRANPTSPELVALHASWAGVTFTAPACPYPGMQPFTAGQGHFYGRTAEIEIAVDCLRRYPFLAILGPSGSGKSSLLAAGILPALATSHHFAARPFALITMRPGAFPYTTLHALYGARQATTGDRPAPLTPGGGAPRLLLVVDQYEEIYTTATADQRQQFEQELLQWLALGSTTLILCARADFYTNLMTSPLWPQIADHNLPVAPLRDEALRAAITAPARDVGVELDAALVERLLADAGDEPGVLPFVQETLVMLWTHAQNFHVGLDAYTHLVGAKSGRSGLQVALAKHAGHVFRTELHDTAERAMARRILLRLVQFGEGRPDTRRQQTVAELQRGLEGASTFARVLGILTANRLLTLNDEARLVDLSHEALIQGWPELAGWIEAQRTAEQTRRRLEDKALERLRLRQGGESAGLLDAFALDEAEKWRDSPEAADLGASPDLLRLIGDSREAVARAAADQQRRTQVLTAVAVTALLAMLIALVFFSRAQTAAEAARNAEATAQANALLADNARATAQANALLAETARATAQANFALAQQQLDQLQVAALLDNARARRLALDLDGATRALAAAAAAAAARGTALDVSQEMTATIRYIAATFVQHGEKLLCEARSTPNDGCTALVAAVPGAAANATAAIDPRYLSWAEATAPQIAGWATLTSTVQQHGVISATALFSQALALNPPPDTPVYVWIPPGAFTMGSTEEDCAVAGAASCPTEEQPSHAVILGGYWLQRIEVSNEQYGRCVNAGACKVPANSYWNLPSSAGLPVTDISWTKAAAYAALVGGRLPTEAEWEKGCRGTDSRIYPWGNAPPAPELLNYYNESGRTTEVGAYPPGANGLYHMAGNAWEWVADWYSPTYYTDSPRMNPPGPPATGYKVLRGGSWRNDSGMVRCAFRDNDPPDSKYYNVGFRVVAPGF